MNEAHWREYHRDRLIKDEVDFLVIVPREYKQPIPLSCPICDRMYRDQYDESSHIESGCCHACALRFVHPDRKRWNSGCRPSSKDVLESVSQRPELRIVLDLD